MRGEEKTKLEIELYDFIYRITKSKEGDEELVESYVETIIDATHDTSINHFKKLVEHQVKMCNIDLNIIDIVSLNVNAKEEYKQFVKNLEAVNNYLNRK